jgi:hypothetical protein
LPTPTGSQILDPRKRTWDLVSCARAWRGLTGGEVKANLSPNVRYSRAAVERTVHTLQRRIDRRTVNVWGT